MCDRPVDLSLAQENELRRMPMTQLDRSDIGALAPGMCADDYAGALNDPVAAIVFCAPQKARYTVINGRVIVENGQVTTTIDMTPVIEAHNRFSRELASTQLTRSS
jgi:hypothetical protein